MGHPGGPLAPQLQLGPSPSASPHPRAAPPSPGADTCVGPRPRMPASCTSHLCCQHRDGERLTQVPASPFGVHIAFKGLVCLCSASFTSIFSPRTASPANPPPDRQREQSSGTFFEVPPVTYSAILTVNQHASRSLQGTLISWLNPN